MALDAGSVFTVLGGKFTGGGFAEFDAANKAAAANATAAEAQITASQGRLGAVLGRTAKAQQATELATRKASLAQSNQAEAVARNESETAKLEKTVRNSGVATKLQAAELGRLSAQHDVLTSAIQDTSAKTSLWSKYNAQAGQNLQKVGTVGAKVAAVGILALGAATVYAVTKAVSFNQEMLRLHTQAGATTDEVVRFKDAVLSLAGTVPQSPKELSEGLYHIVSAGFKGAEALHILEASAKGAALGNANLEDTSNALIGTLASHVKGVKNAADAQGQLNAITGVGNMRMEDLAKSVGTGVLPTFAAAGLSLKDYGAALATITDNSTPANVTATRLRMTIAQMVSPTKAAQKELASIGLTSTSLATDLRQPNGLLVAIQDLRTHLKDSGKTAVEQDQILSNAFGRGKSSAAIITLVGEISRLEAKYKQLGETDGVKRLNEGWAAFQKEEGTAFKELKSGAEAFAVTVGKIVLPELSKLSKGLSEALSGFIKEGGARKVGAGVKGVFSTIGQVVTGLAPPIEAVAKALFDFGKAAGLGNAGELTALIGGFLAFKGLSFVAPILTAIAAGIAEVGVAAATAPSVAAFGADLVALAGGPVGAIVLALSLAAGAFLAINSGMFSSASAADRMKAAIEADTAAIRGLQDATNKAATAGVAGKRATQEHKEALEGLHRVEKEIADGSLKGTAAQNALNNAHIQVAETAARATEATKSAQKAVHDERVEAEKATKATSARSAETFKEIQTLQEMIKNHQATKATYDQLTAAKQKYNQETREEAQANAEVQVSEESRRRIEAGGSAIAKQNAQGVQKLQNALFESGAPKSIVTKYELDDQGAQAKLGNLIASLHNVPQTVVAKVLTNAPSAAAAIAGLNAIIHGVPASKVISILHNAPSAKSAMNSLAGAVRAVPGNKNVNISTNADAARGVIGGVQAAVDALHGKTIEITTINNAKTITGSAKAGGHASGRGAGSAEAAVVGEGSGPEYVIDSSGKGVVVTEPTLMGLGPQDYVVPTEDRFRGRALGLFSMLARDLEIPGYKAGKPKAAAAKAKTKAPARHYTVPNAIPPLSLPLSDIESKEQAAKSSYDKAATKVNSLEGKVRTAERNLQFASKKGTAKAKDKAVLADLHKQLAAAKRSKAYTTEHLKMEEWKRTLGEAKAFQADINKRTLEVNNAGNAMKLAAGRDDIGGYNAAKGKRLGALGALEALIAKARKQVKTGTEYALELEGKLQTAESEQQGTEGEALEPVQSSEQRTGETPAEQAQQKAIEARIALSALTPDLGDDKSAAGELVSFLTNVLGEVQREPGPRGGDEGIIAVAGALKTAQSNLASFSGSGTNENSDLQAQITQANQRAEVAQQTAQTAERALQVFAGSGDIGAGGRNAAGAGANITINTLHPADPATLTAIGNAAVSGIGYQGSIRAVRAVVGP